MANSMIPIAGRVKDKKKTATCGSPSHSAAGDGTMKVRRTGADYFTSAIFEAVNCSLPLTVATVPVASACCG
jgi:hypothetical protein